MKILVTGGCGFIGAHASAALQTRGHEVLIMDNLSRKGTYENLQWLKENGTVHFLEVDLRDANGLATVFREHKDIGGILHLAGQVAVTSSVQDPRADFESNALGTFNLLEAARQHAEALRLFIYSSTNKVYGGLEHAKVTLENGRWTLLDRPHGISEEETLDFHSPYGCSKGAADMYVRDYNRIYQLPSVVFRQSCIYGTRQFGIEDQGWVAWMIIAALTNQPITIYGDGRQIRDLLWIEDLVALYTQCFESPESVQGEAYNVGGGQGNTLSLLELLAWIKEHHQPALKYTFENERPGDQKVFVSDNRKLTDANGWKPTTTPEVGLCRLAKWVEENKALINSILTKKRSLD